MKGRAIRVLVVWIASVCAILFLTGTREGEAQDDLGWKVYVKTSPCSGRFDWVTVSKVNPTGRGGSGYWQNADLIIDGTGMRCVNESSSVCTKAAADAEATIVGGNSKFKDYCCKEYTVWQHQLTKKMTIVLGKFGNPGPGWIFEDGPMCCEDAEELSGLTGACSGRAANCFANDPGMGSTNKDDHLNWANGQNGATLAANLKAKVDALFGCSSLNDDGFAAAFADLSAAIAMHVRSSACFNGDVGAVSADRNAHYQWARSLPRRKVYENLQWKIAAAMKCLDLGKQKTFFVDLAVPAARISPTTTTGIRETNPRIVDDKPKITGTNLNWAGSWGDAGTTVNISGGGSSISASFGYQSGDSSGTGQWSNCRVAGNTAECDWTASHNDSTKSGTRKGTLKVTLSGNSISGSYYEDEPKWTYKGDRNASNTSSSMRKGVVWPFTYPRK